MWTAIGYGEVDAFIIIVLFSGQGPVLTQSTEQVGNKMWKRDMISWKNRWSSYRMSLYWQCTVDVDVSLICASSWEWFINMVMSGNVILSLYLPRLTSDKLEGADVVMLIVSLIVVCLLIIYETYMVGGLIVPDHFMTAAIDVYVALTSQQSLYTGDVDDVSLTWRLCSST